MLLKFDQAYRVFTVTASVEQTDHKLLFRQFSDLLNLSLSVLRQRIMALRPDFSSIRSDSILSNAAELRLIGDIREWKEMVEAWEALPKLRGPITLGHVVRLISTKFRDNFDALHQRMMAEKETAS